jgi:hypothetical protein
VFLVGVGFVSFFLLVVWVVVWVFGANLGA